LTAKIAKKKRKAVKDAKKHRRTVGFAIFAAESALLPRA
jgi:hypothetical protein